MKSFAQKVSWIATAGGNPVNQSPANNAMLDELPMRMENELWAVKRAAWRMFCACITLFILNVILSITSWDQFRENERLSQRLFDEQTLRHSMEFHPEGQP